MKHYFILILAALLTNSVMGQYTQNFDATNALTSGCVLISNVDRTILPGEAISGLGSLYSNPPVNGSGTRDYATPYLDVLDPLDATASTTSFTVSFDYKLNEALNGQATRYIEIGLQGVDGYTSLTTILMDKDNDPLTSTSFSQTFTVAAGVKRLVLKMGGSNGNGSVRIIIDNLVTSADAHYSLSGTCNTIPSILNDVYFTAETNVYTGSSVLQNDNDPDGEGFSAPAIVTPSPDGTVVMNADGTFTFTANPGFTGSVTSFTYAVSDNGYEPVSGTATVTIFFQAMIILPVKCTGFEGTLVNSRAQLKWTVEENETGERFEIEKSISGTNFSTIGTVAASGKGGQESYVYNEATDLIGGAYYRIKILNKDNSQSYTKTVYLRTDGKKRNGGITLLRNPVQSSLAFSYRAPANGPARVNVYNALGALVQSFTVTLQEGMNTVVHPLDNRLGRGSYILELTTASERSTAKLLK